MKNKIKKAVYLALSAAASVMLLTTLGIAMEWSLVDYNQRMSPEMAFYGTLAIMGTIVGLAFGNVAWQKIYVEGVRGKKYILK